MLSTAACALSSPPCRSSRSSIRKWIRWRDGTLQLSWTRPIPPQTGSSALKLKAALADTEDALREYAEIEGKAEEELDPDDRLMREMTVQGRHKNLSFFAFTATPKDKTLELFGTEYEDGSFHPFHIYSMRQAIEEGFILDVLQNYMTYDTCFKIVKTSGR